jgi:hypothetical protein
MNEALPKLLRSIANGTDATASKQSVIFNAAADEIERLLTEAKNERLANDLRDEEIGRLTAEVDRLQFEYERADEAAKRLGAKWTERGAENERMKALINNKQYIKLLADYNRGHLSHYNWLKEQDGGIRE